MPRRADLPEDNHRAIDVFAKAAATSITEQLSQATNVIHQNAGDHMSTPHELESYLDMTLTGVFGREPIQMLGMSKPVVLAIGQHIKPASRDATEIFIPGNTDLVPHRLLQRSTVPVLKEATKEFAEELCSVFHSTLIHDIRYCGENVCATFSREQKLHKQRHGMSKGQRCCMFRLMIEDYADPDVSTKTEIVYFGFKCANCDGRHEMKVFR